MSIDKRITELTNEFITIVDIKNEIDLTFTILEERITKLKDLHRDFTTKNKQTLFTFGLDSFHFQSKLIDIEYDDMNRLFSAITNRMYCEFFKLYKLICDYIIENIPDKRLINLINANNDYPIYKDLEPFKKYDFAIIHNLHEFIIELLQSIYGNVINQEHELLIHKSKNSIGINIDNFVSKFQFNILVIREKALLFINYVDFFHKLHRKILERFTSKLQLMFSQLDHDIKFEDCSELNKIRQKAMIDNFIKDNISPKLLADLTNNILLNEMNSESELSSASSFDMKIELTNPIKNNNIVLDIEPLSFTQLEPEPEPEPKPKPEPEPVEPIKKVEELVKKVEKKIESVPVTVPVKKVEPVPLKKEEPIPEKKESVPVKKEEPVKKVEPVPVKKVEPVKKEEPVPVKKVEEPVKKVEEPVKKVEPIPVKKVEEPIKKVEPVPVKKVEEPVKKVESIKKEEPVPVKKIEESKTPL